MSARLDSVDLSAIPLRFDSVGLIVDPGTVVIDWSRYRNSDLGTFVESIAARFPDQIAAAVGFVAARRVLSLQDYVGRRDNPLVVPMPFGRHQAPAAISPAWPRHYLDYNLLL